MKREILLLIMIFLVTSDPVLASDADLTGKGYQFASVSSGEMLSPLMDVSLDGGTVVKPEGEPFSFWKLNVGDVADFNFRLPMDTDSATDGSKEAGAVTNLQAYILLYSEKPGQIARIRWNRQLMTDPATIITTGEPGKFLITIPLPDPKAENQLRILPVTDSILIQSVKLTYSYALPSSTVGDVTVTLLAPDQDKHELSDPLTFRWRASGPCNNGWISLEYRPKGSEQWQPVPGAESFDRLSPEWPADDLGSFTWTNHGLKSFPSVKITYHDGESPRLVKLRTAAEFFEQAQKLTDEKKFDEALAEVNKALELCPDEAKYKDGKKAIQTAKEEFLEQQKREKAAEFFEQAQKLNDEKKFDEALTEVNKALELYPDEAKYKDRKKAIQTAKEEFLARQKADRFYQEALKLKEASNIVEAIAEVEKALELFSDEAKYKELKQLLSSNEYRFQSGKNGGDRAYLTIDGVEFAFRYCPAGVFMMGSPESEEGRDFDETPHQVTIRKGFWMLETEVTQKQWKAVMENNPSNYQGDDLPVEGVNWNVCQDFCRKLSSLSGLTIKLPSEAQWEYACRAGTTGAYSGRLNSMAWYYENIGSNLHSVKTKKPNAWGLYDMHGNVFEWCEDNYTKNISSQSTDTPILINAESESRVFRGGSWTSIAKNCRSAYRHYGSPMQWNSSLGFRAVIVVP